MPARDIYHDTVKNALIKDGWTITHDPFLLRYGLRRLYADLGAEKLLAAAKARRSLVVEIKSFSGPSEVADLQEALGAYGMYRHILADIHPGWELCLAVPQDAYHSIFTEPLGQLMIGREKLHLLVFDQVAEVISQWIP
jgi:hypothetical protein